MSSDDAGEDRILIASAARVSWQCTDSGSGRFAAFHEAISTLAVDEQIPTATLRYSSWVHTTPFATESDEFYGFLDPAQGLGPAGDLQGAIATAVDLVESDAGSDDDEHNYHIIFVDTAAPSPICTDGCENDNLNEFEEDAGGVCEVEQDEIPDDEYVDFDAPCTDYNLFDTLSERLQDLEAAAPNMEIHFALAIDDEESIESVCGDTSDTGFDFAENADHARELFSDLLSEIDAGGEFVDTAPEDLNLEEILNL